MNSSLLLKIFEYALLPSLEKCLKLNDLQMGFRPFTGCKDAIMICKEVVMNNNAKGSNVHCAFIDLSKVFDKLDHNVLNEKLLKSNVPRQVARIINYMLRNTNVHVAHDDYVGKAWNVREGSRQGGVLSGLLFNFYMKSCIDDLLNLDVGCMLGPYRTNVIAYADDIILMAPSANGLQILLNKFNESIAEIKLTINVSKSKYMIFKHHKSYSHEPRVFLNNMLLERVFEHKYLGIMLVDNIDNCKDADRVTNSFLKQFNSMYYRFNFADKNILNYLFVTYATSFYGIELWYNGKNRNKYLRTPAVAYHKAIKKLYNLSPYDSNHYACDIGGFEIFKHLQSKRMLKYCYSLFKSQGSCMKRMRYYINFLSNVKSNIRRIFQNEYDITDVFRNDIDAVLSRIKFVQNHEPRSIF